MSRYFILTGTDREVRDWKALRAETADEAYREACEGVKWQEHEWARPVNPVMVEVVSETALPLYELWQEAAAKRAQEQTEYERKYIRDQVAKLKEQLTRLEEEGVT